MCNFKKIKIDKIKLLQMKLQYLEHFLVDAVMPVRTEIGLVLIFSQLGYAPCMLLRHVRVQHQALSECSTRTETRLWHYSFHLKTQ